MEVIMQEKSQIIGSILAPAGRSAKDLVDEFENPEIVTRGAQIQRLLTEIKAQDPY